MGMYRKFVVKHASISSYHSDSPAIKDSACFLSLGVNCMACEKAVTKAEISSQKCSEVVDLNTLYHARELTLNAESGCHLFYSQPCHS